MSQKLISFTEKERQMIIHSVLLPKGAVDVEVDVFIDVCEKYGFDPLQKDIIFQRYESKGTPTVSYMVTKDAWFKHAKRQKGFKNILKGVVHEGDHFEVDVMNETVIHKFGAKRGNIIGAWALMRTDDVNYIEFVNFNEYYQAFRGKSGKSNLWDTMPSAMITKTAIINVIKNAYPLGIQFRGDEEMEDIELEDSVNNAQPPVQGVQTGVQEETQIVQQMQQQMYQQAPEQKWDVAEPVQTPGPNEETVVQEEVATVNEPVSANTQLNVAYEEQQNGAVQNVQQLQGETSVQTQAENQPIQPTIPAGAFKFVTKVVRQSTQTGQPTTAVTAENENGRTTLYAINDLLNAFDGFVDGDLFKCETEMLFGTLCFVRSLEKIA
ncbi:recombinase RecT [Lysinibacillus sphaericus]|uniref:RecT family recombinase n=1 Tax=Lysinibacillus sphaericus TaxID=1421 RepID=UPI003F798FFF